MKENRDDLILDYEDYEALFQLTAELICIADPSGQIRSFNPALLKTLGAEADSIPGRNIQDFIHPESQLEFSKKLKSVQQGKAFAHLEVCFRCQNQNWIWLSWSAVPLPKKNIVFWVGRDITESKKNAIEKEEASRLLQHTVDSLPIIVAYMDTEFHYKFMNAAYQNWVGEYAESVRQGDLEKIMPKESADKLRDHRDRSKATAQASRFEIVFQNRQRHPRTLEVQYHPHKDPNGKVIGLFALGLDITERKEMEQALQQQQIQMLTSSRLSAIGEMASGVAHEINNPLSIILSHAEALRINAERGKLSTENVLKSSDRIEATVKRISRIIRSLRSLSRDSQNDPIEPVPVKKIIEDAVEICRQRFKNHQISLMLPAVSPDLIIQVRPTQISQVLLNLLNNAFDAVEGLETRKVEVSVQQANDFVEISVTDNGKGIPVHLQDQIFEPFFTTKEPSKGTGLGLSVSRNIVISHHGQVEVESSPGKTRMIVRLPVSWKNSPGPEIPLES